MHVVEILESTILSKEVCHGSSKQGQEAEQVKTAIGRP